MQVELHIQPGPIADFDRLVDYAQRVVNLDHPALAKILDVGVLTTGSLVLITPAIRGRLEDTHQRLPVVPDLPAACSIVLTLCGALDYLHRAHFRGGLSLSWADCVRASTTADGTWQLAVLPPTPSQLERASATSGFAGVLRLAAPDLLGSGPAIPTPASDSFSLGALLFELLTGKPLVQSRSIAEMVQELRVGHFRTVSDLRPDLPPELGTFMDRALEPHPENRPSLQEWCVAMQAFGGSPLSQPPVNTAEEVAGWTADQSTELRISSLTQVSAPELLVRIADPPTTGIYGGIMAIIPEHRGLDRGLESIGTPLDESFAFGPSASSIEVDDSTSQLARSIESQPRLTPVPASIATHAEPRPRRADDVDAVDCTVFAPPAAAAGDSIMVQLFAHTPQQAEDAIQMAREFDETAKRLGFSSLDLEIPRGTRLNVELALPGLDIDESVQSIVWRGRAMAIQFGVTVPPAHAAGNVIGKVTVYLESTPIGHIRFKILITASLVRRTSLAPAPVAPLPVVGSGAGKPEPQPLGDQARRYQQVFVSYAMKDLNEVMKRVQMLDRLHVNYFQDLLDLEPGERWERRLYKHIDDCDVFMLFWSQASKDSKWVTKEVQYALDRKGGDDSRLPEIVPVMIEGPPVPLPNPELAHLHFNDKLLYYMKPLQG